MSHKKIDQLIEIFVTNFSQKKRIFLLKNRNGNYGQNFYQSYQIKFDFSLDKIRKCRNVCEITKMGVKMLN